MHLFCWTLFLFGLSSKVKHEIFSFLGFYLALEVVLEQTSLGEQASMLCYWGDHQENKHIRWYHKKYQGELVTNVASIHFNLEKGQLQKADIPADLQDKVSENI